MEAYTPTKPVFMKTSYNGKYLYALKIELVCGAVKFESVIGLGDDLNYVKGIARGFNECRDMTLYLSIEQYANDIPFYKSAECSSGGAPLYYSCDIERLCYHNGDSFFYLGYKELKDCFDYKVRRGDFILAQKNGDKWEIPPKMPSRVRYPTIVIPLDKLLK